MKHDYYREKSEFLKKHNGIAETSTSSMDQYGVYHKEYTCEDEAVWYEVCGPVWESVEAEARGVKFTADVKLFRIEYWNSDNAKSEYYYERF